MSMVTCSACLIVRNECHRLECCLRSIQDDFDEIVVVDTGSTDGSQEICRVFGAQVYEFLWNDDFSAARNESLRHASGDWIFWIDADEELWHTKGSQWKAELGERKEDVIPINATHFYGEEPPIRERSYQTVSHRFFRNRKGISFRGKIHEHLDLSSQVFRISEEPLQGFELLHYGYLEEVVQAKNKHIRNMELLRREKLDTDDPWIAYHIAGEYYRMKEFTQAFQEVNHAIRRFLEEGSVPPPLVYKLKYDLVVQSNVDQANVNGIERALLLYPDYVDLQYYKALMLLRLERYGDAFDAFRCCLQPEATSSKYLTLHGVNSFYPLYYMGICCEALQNSDDARQFYEKALLAYPAFLEAAERLAALEPCHP